MDQRTFQRYDNFMYGYGLWLSGGRAAQGQYPQGISPARRTSPPQRLNSKRLPKDAPDWEKARKPLRKAMLTQPHGTRPQGKSKVLLFHIDPAYQKAHNSVLTMPEDWQRLVGLAWVRPIPLDNLADVFDLPRHGIRKMKVEVFESLPIML